MEKDDRIGIWSPNYYEWIVTQFGAALAGLILVNVNPMYRSEDIIYAIENVGIKALIAPPRFKNSKYYEMLATVIPGLDTMPLGVGNVSCDSFPKLRHVIVFDENNEYYR